jgi:hypothetical protein
MPLQLPPINFKDLNSLVVEYNKTSENDGVQRLFYLQKINYLINKTKLSNDLFDWLELSGPEGWETHLLTYNINPDASFFLKGIQFAAAVAKRIKDKPELDDRYPNEFDLMQARDNLLINSSYADSRNEYITICCRLNEIATNDESIKNVVNLQTEILEMAKVKIRAIKGRDNEEPIMPGTTYSTKELGVQGNNFNYKFTMNGWDKPFVFRVEDRLDFDLEQSLHSHEVAKYLISDYAVFRMKFKDGVNSSQYKPVILSQFANQGNLAEVAKRLKAGPERDIAPQVVSYFARLTDFCNKLIEAGAYHPDIKLSNFLVSDNTLKVADRKTLINIEAPLANKVRSSPFYSPEEYLDCISPRLETYNHKAHLTIINMPQFMAFQLGIALKEFLVLTQFDELPDNFSDPSSNASSHFKSPPKQIINLSLLVQELTRRDPTKRMSIKQFQSLLVHHNMNPDNFYNEVEKIFPSADIGIQEEIKVITDLLNSALSGTELLKKANLEFNKISENYSQEIRLTRLAEKLANKCFKEHSQHYFAECSREIESLFPQQAWEQAPWYRKVLYYLSFGYYEVDSVDELDHATIKTSFDFKGEEFQSHLQQLQFIHIDEFKKQLGTTEGTHLYDFIVYHMEEMESEETESSSLITPENSSAIESMSSTEQKKDTMVLVKEQQNDSEDENTHSSNNSLNSGTIVFSTVKNLPQEQSDSSQASSQFRFFNRSKASANEVSAGAAKKVFLSVGKSLFQGDGAYRKKNKGYRTLLNEINWDTTGPTDAPEQQPIKIC